MPEQLAKASSLIVVTVGGNVTPLNPEQPANALFPIHVTVNVSLFISIVEGIVGQ